MCNNYARRGTFYEYAEGLKIFGIRIIEPIIHEVPNYPIDDDIRPTEQSLIFRERDDGIEIVPARWWLIPRFYKGPLKGWKRTTFNARSEEIRETQSFKQSFKDRRCLIPANGWFEYTGDSKVKDRWEITPRDRQWFCMAGLWDRAETSDEGTVDSFTMVMQSANRNTAHLNDRAPIVLPREHWATWLDTSADVDFLMGPEAPDIFDYRQVPSRSKTAKQRTML